MDYEDLLSKIEENMCYLEEEVVELYPTYINGRIAYAALDVKNLIEKVIYNIDEMDADMAKDIIESIEQLLDERTESDCYIKIRDNELVDLIEKTLREYFEV